LIAKGDDMKAKIKVADLPKLDISSLLDSEEAIAAFLADIMANNDPALMISALGTIARARGMTEIAKSAGLTRPALYRALQPDKSPRFDTILRVCGALGVRLVPQPVGPGRKSHKKAA
jgi:probable addiction module antidote protein